MKEFDIKTKMYENRSSSSQNLIPRGNSSSYCCSKIFNDLAIVVQESRPLSIFKMNASNYL